MEEIRSNVVYFPQLCKFSQYSAVLNSQVVILETEVRKLQQACANSILFIKLFFDLPGWRPFLELGRARIVSEGPASSQLGLGLVVAKKLFLITPFLFISLASVSFQGTFVEHPRFLRLNLSQNGIPYQEDDHHPSRTDFIHPSFVFRISYLLQIFFSSSTFGFQFWVPTRDGVLSRWQLLLVAFDDFNSGVFFCHIRALGFHEILQAQLKANQSVFLGPYLIHFYLNLMVL